MRLFLILFTVLITASCASSNMPLLDADKMYERDLVFDVQAYDSKKNSWSDKVRYVGVGVLPRASKYRVTLYASGKVDLMVLRSCHQLIKTPKPKRKGGWFSKRYYEFDFTVDGKLEMDQSCAINLGIYNQKDGQHGWGLIAVNWSHASLRPFVRCNGKRYEGGGTTFCQAKAGQVQQLEFDRPVETSFYGDCEIDVPDDGKIWKYKMPPGKCVLHFFDAEENEHVAYMYGYRNLIIRGVD